jgi:hypothetical protein
MKSHRFAIALTTSLLVFSSLVFSSLVLSSFASAQENRPMKLAQAATCQSWFNTCVSRCKSAAPDDTTCPRTNCGPKLTQCRSTGCWQQGQAFGGGQVCNLAK